MIRWRTMTLLLTLLIPALLGGCDVVGGGDTVVTGEGNTVFEAGGAEAVAALLADLPTTPRIEDAELAALLATIRQQAGEGDLDAALVLLRIAAIQREREAEAAAEAAEQ